MSIDQIILTLFLVLWISFCFNARNFVFNRRLLLLNLLYGLQFTRSTNINICIIRINCLALSSCYWTLLWQGGDQWLFNNAILIWKTDNSFRCCDFIRRIINKDLFKIYLIMAIKACKQMIKKYTSYWDILHDYHNCKYMIDFRY